MYKKQLKLDLALLYKHFVEQYAADDKIEKEIRPKDPTNSDYIALRLTQHIWTLDFLIKHIGNVECACIISGMTDELIEALDESLIRSINSTTTKTKYKSNLRFLKSELNKYEEEYDTHYEN